MSKRQRSQSISISVEMNEYVPPPKTVLLDQIGTGCTYGYEDNKDGRWCSGEPVSHRRSEQSSLDRSWSNRIRGY